MPLVDVLLALDELETEESLVDFERSVNDGFGREIFLQSLLVDRVLGLLDHGVVVAHVPKVKLPVEVVAVLLALK